MEELTKHPWLSLDCVWIDRGTPASFGLRSQSEEKATDDEEPTTAPAPKETVPQSKPRVLDAVLVNTAQSSSTNGSVLLMESLAA